MGRLIAAELVSPSRSPCDRRHRRRSRHRSNACRLGVRRAQTGCFATIQAAVGRRARRRHDQDRPWHVRRRNHHRRGPHAGGRRRGRDGHQWRQSCADHRRRRCRHRADGDAEGRHDHGGRRSDQPDRSRRNTGTSAAASQIPWAADGATGATVTISDSVVTGNRATPTTSVPSGGAQCPTAPARSRAATAAESATTET